jgi:fumarate reductase iron-sulfur subunit
MSFCGSCGMMVNGEPSLTCKTFVRDLPDNVRIEPLENFPIERDLVVVLDDVMEKLQKAKPYIIRHDDPPPEDTEYTQSRGALHKFKQYTMCVNCMCCYAACPQYALDNSFIGPAVLALAHRYNVDSRDQGKSERLDILADHDGVWDCSFVGACSEVCPKSVDPAAAIQQMKIDGAKEWWKQKLAGGKS